LPTLSASAALAGWIGYAAPTQCSHRNAVRGEKSGLDGFRRADAVPAANTGMPFEVRIPDNVGKGLPTYGRKNECRARLAIR
jgi:hypothetical protein